MLNRSRRMNLLKRCAIALCAFVDIATSAELDPTTDLHALVEVRHLSELPPNLAKDLGWQGGESDKIGDLEREPGTSRPNLINQWFLLGGMSKSYALVAVENRAAYPSFNRFHARSFTLVDSKWVVSGEWTLASAPHTVGELAQLLDSPESQALTTRWRGWQHERDLDQRRYRSAPTLSYRANSPLRKVNINDEEVRQIQDVVHGLIPGAIVLISGVVEGCPCEDGAGCSAQVWTAIDRSEGTRSLELSDINDHWVIGPVQRWFLDSAQLERQHFPTRADYFAALAKLNNRYPTCSTGPSTTP